MKYLLPIISFLAVGLAGAEVAYALANPTTLQIEEVRRYNNVAVSGDALIIVHYAMTYTVLPTETITEGWVGRLFDNGGAGQLSSVSPTSEGVIPNNGYSHGVFSFYFAAFPTITGTLQVRLEGNPALFPTPTGITTTSIETRTASQLESDLRIWGLHFEQVWNQNVITFAAGPGRFTDEGSNYFTAAIPNVSQYAPDVFSLGFIQPNPTAHVDSPDTSYQTGRDAFWNNTPLRAFTTAWGTQFGVSRVVLETILVLVLGGFFGWMIFQKWQEQEPAIFVMIIWVNVAAFMGLGPLAFPYVLAFTAVFILAYLIFFRPAAA